MISTIEWRDRKVYMIDQRKLPQEEVYVEHRSHKDVADSIKSMVIRGAPAIGVAAAMGVALGVINFRDNEPNFEVKFLEILKELSSTRPTAVNLFWAIERMKKVFYANKFNIKILKEEVVKEARKIQRDDVRTNKMLGKNGEMLLKDNFTVLTHCNAGSLATAGYGTALGVIRSAVENGKKISVIACETRPFLQGARLTVWEMQKENIPVTLITDSMAGSLMEKGEVDAIVVGADRIALNGDVANKIGTYSLAVLAKYHGIPFYVAAPLSTIDPNIKDGSEIPIEERDANEVKTFLGTEIVLPETKVFNPAFDVTPFSLITGIVTEEGIVTSDPENNFKTLRK